MQQPKPIVLPPAVFDAFELSCLVFGGIGSDKYFDGACGDYAGATGSPVCLVGHAMWASNSCDIDNDVERNPMLSRFPGNLGARICDNDHAVSVVRERLGKAPYARVSWKAYCKQRNIVRGSHKREVANAG